MKVLSESESKERLGAWLPICREQRTQSVSEARDFVTGLDEEALFVAKASGVAHKTEGSLVRLGLTGDGVLAQWDELATRGDGSVLVADFVRPDYELLLGSTRDAQFGPVLTVGHGGVMTEVLDDAVCFLSPLDRADFESGLASLRCAPLLRGMRGQEAIDLDALFELAQHVVGALEHDAEVAEIDLNPVAVVAGQPVVLDALVVLAEQ